jgi:hypothetical protein
MEEIWSELIPTGIKIPFTVYKHRFFLHYWWKKFQVGLNGGKTNIVIIGRPSVGKSILCHHLNGKVNIKYNLPETSEETETEIVKLKNWTKIIRVIPGQPSNERYSGLDEAFNSHKELEGLIYVVDWGYTAEKNKLVRSKIINELKIDDIDKLRKYNLDNELADFTIIINSLKQSISQGRGPKWIMIAVNKVDLYFNEIDEAQKYYDPSFKSNFSDILNGFVKYVGEQNIKCLSLPICCWETNLEWNGHTIKTDIGGRENEQALFSIFYHRLTSLSQ